MENKTTVNKHYKLVTMMMDDWKKIILIRLKKYQQMDNITDLLVIDELNMVLNLMGVYKDSFNEEK